MYPGAISAMYMGDKPEAIPIAIPPKNRAAKNPLKMSNAPVPYAEIRKINAEIDKSGFRPIKSARLPDTIAPTRHPASAMLMASPCSDGESLIPKYTS